MPASRSNANLDHGPGRRHSARADRPTIPDVAVIIPTYNEADNLARVALGVLALGPSYTLIVVDDASPDGTGAIADRLADAHPGRVRVVHRSGARCLGFAYLDGIRAAVASDAEVVAVMDADGSHDPAALPTLVRRLDEADMTLGSRYAPGGATPGWPTGRRALSRGGGTYARLVLGLRIADPTSGYRAMSRAVAVSVAGAELQAAGFAANLELTWRAVRAGYAVAEVPIAFRDRTAGRSKLSRRIVGEGVLLVWRLRFGRDRRAHERADGFPAPVPAEAGDGVGVASTRSRPPFPHDDREGRAVVDGCGVVANAEDVEFQEIPSRGDVSR